jgi:hypothetical protein
MEWVEAAKLYPGAVSGIALSPSFSLRPQSSSRLAKNFGRLTQIAVSGTTNVSVAVHASPMRWRPVLDVGSIDLFFRAGGVNRLLPGI